MSSLTIKVSVLLLFLWPGTASSLICQERADTATINRMTGEAYLTSRSNPDLTIMQGHKLLSVSKNISYKRGIADASLALGMAYLARYNPGDSACFYNKQALTLYTEMNNNLGIARASYALAYVFSFKASFGESEKFSRQSLEYFEKAGDKRGMVNAYSALTYLARQENDLEKARSLVEQAIETARSINDTIPLADALNSLGNIYKEMALFNLAIECYFDALHLWEGKRDSTGLSIAYGSIALMYYYQKDYERAMLYNFKKLSVSESTGDLWEESKTLNNIAQIYDSREMYDSSLYYIRRGLKLNLRMNLPTGIAGAYHKMGNSLLLKSETDSAFYYVNRAIDIAREIDDPELMNYLVTLGKIYATKKDYSKSLQYATEAYRLADQQNLPMAIAQASALLSDLYSLMGQKDIAFDYLKRYYRINDSISNDQFLKQVTRLELEYEYDRKQKALEFSGMQERILHENKIKQQGLYLRGLLILVFLLGVITLLYFRHSRIRDQYARIDLEQRLLRAQMNPHFIFNSLCAIQSLILSGKPGIANAFLTKIASLMRNILENSREEYISLEKEIETLKLYLDVQQLRFETKFDYNFTVDNAIDPENFSVPPMLAQPCIENSIEHGLLHLKERGHLNISYTLKNDLLMLEVTDNGVGREQSATEPAKGIRKESISTKLTEKRLEYFRRILRKSNITYQIIDLYEGDEATGTSVVMMIPFRKIYA